MPHAQELTLEHYLSLDPAPFLSFHKEAATGKIFAATGYPGKAHPGTNDPEWSVWAFCLHNGEPRAICIPKEKLKGMPVCKYPCQDSEGAALVQALMPWQSWSLFLEAIDMRPQYPDLDFFAFCQKGFEHNMPFSALKIGKYPAVLSRHKNGSYMTSMDYGCKKFYTPMQIDEKTARIINPNFFKRLEMSKYIL